PGGTSAARRSDPNTKRSTRSFHRSIQCRKPDCARALCPVARSAPVTTVAANCRRVMRLGMLTSCEHSQDGTRVQHHHHERHGGKQGEQTEPEEMDGPGPIVAAEETPQPPELHRLIDHQT